jgi:hypothetical protein
VDRVVADDAGRAAVEDRQALQRAGRRRPEHDLALHVFSGVVVRTCARPDIDQIRRDVAQLTARHDGHGDIVDVVELHRVGRGDPELGLRRVPGPAALRYRLDLDVAEAVVAGELRHDLALAEVPFELGARPDARIWHHLEHVLQRAFAGGFVDDRPHRGPIEQRAVFAFLRAVPSRRQQHDDRRPTRQSLHECLLRECRGGKSLSESRTQNPDMLSCVQYATPL